MVVLVSVLLSLETILSKIANALSNFKKYLTIPENNMHAFDSNTDQKSLLLLKIEKSLLFLKIEKSLVLEIEKSLTGFDKQSFHG